MSGLTYVTFDRGFLHTHTDLFQELCALYCTVWENDPFFGEYRKCPICAQYFSRKLVEEQGVEHCPICLSKLVRAWVSDEVGADLLSVIDHYSFSGALALENGHVVGFSWGRLLTPEEMLEKWGDLYTDYVRTHCTNPFCFYLNELGVSEAVRQQGIGTHLVRLVLMQPFCRYPQVMAALSTHGQSPARKLYEKFGFEEVFVVPNGQGRIRMAIPNFWAVRGRMIAP